MGDTSKRLGPGSTAPAVIVHGLAAARAAVAAADPARGLVLCSAPGAGIYAGAGWFAALARAAALGHPGLVVDAVLDCADAPGAVLAGLRAGLRAIVFTGAGADFATLAAIATETGALLLARTPPALDLAGFRPGDARWQALLARHLAQGAGQGAG